MYPNSYKIIIALIPVRVNTHGNREKKTKESTAGSEPYNITLFLRRLTEESKPHSSSSRYNDTKFMDFCRTLWQRNCVLLKKKRIYRYRGTNLLIEGRLLLLHEFEGQGAETSLFYSYCRCCQWKTLKQCHIPSVEFA